MKSRAELEAETILKYRKKAKDWGISEADAERKARALLSANSDADLREFLKKPMKGLSINALDPAHAAADRELQKMAREVNHVYSQAADSMQDKLAEYLKRFETEDKKIQEKLANGEITDKEYKKWRQAKLLQSKRWEQMSNVLAKDADNANEIAKSVIGDHMPEVYAENYNYAQYEIERGIQMDTTFTLYDHNTVENLLKGGENVIPMPKTGMASAKDIKWNRRQIQGELLQGILQGESNQKIAKRMQNVTGANMKTAMRYARTMTTAAENAGRDRMAAQAQKNGIRLRRAWMATLDGRTRDSHRAIDGEERAVGEAFSNGCMFPGDHTARPGEYYNCRCTLKMQIKGFETNFSDMSWRNNDKLNNVSYEEWKAGKKGKK